MKTEDTIVNEVLEMPHPQETDEHPRPHRRLRAGPGSETENISDTHKTVRTVQTPLHQQFNPDTSHQGPRSRTRWRHDQARA